MYTEFDIFRPCFKTNRAKEPCDCGRSGRPTRAKCCHKVPYARPGGGHDRHEDGIDDRAVLFRKFHPSLMECDKCPFCSQLVAVSKLQKIANHPCLLQVHIRGVHGHCRLLHPPLPGMARFSFFTIPSSTLPSPGPRPLLPVRCSGYCFSIRTSKPRSSRICVCVCACVCEFLFAPCIYWTIIYLRSYLKRSECMTGVRCIFTRSTPGNLRTTPTAHRVVDTAPHRTSSSTHPVPGRAR